MKKDEAISALHRIESKIKSHQVGGQPCLINIMIRLDQLLEKEVMADNLGDEVADLRQQIKERA